MALRSPDPRSLEGLHLTLRTSAVSKRSSWMLGPRNGDETHARRCVDALSWDARSSSRSDPANAGSRVRQFDRTHGHTELRGEPPLDRRHVDCLALGGRLRGVRSCTHTTGPRRGAGRSTAIPLAVPRQSTRSGSAGRLRFGRRRGMRRSSMVSAGCQVNLYVQPTAPGHRPTRAASRAKAGMFRSSGLLV